MPEPNERARTRLTAPRVDFDLSALALGMIGYVLLEVMWRVLAPALGVAESVAIKVAPTGAETARAGFEALEIDMWTRLLTWLRALPYLQDALVWIGWQPILEIPPGEGKTARLFTLDLPVWKYVVAAVVLLLVWSVISGAIARVHAVRIARDESRSFDDGLAFSLRNLKAFLMAPLFILGAAAFFAALNAAAGALSAVPMVGGVLQFVLHPLVLLSSLVLMIVVLGGVFGLPLLHAALATERNGMLDAISRTFSYLFTRPVTFIVGVVVVVLVSGIIGSVGGWFVEHAAMETLAFGASWNADTVAAMSAGFDTARGGLFPGAMPDLDTSAKITVWVTWFWSAIAYLLVRGFVLSYAVGGLTDLYFLLRKEVDLTEETEIFDENEPELDLGDPLPDQPSPPA